MTGGQTKALDDHKLASKSSTFIIVPTLTYTYQALNSKYMVRANNDNTDGIKFNSSVNSCLLELPELYYVWLLACCLYVPLVQYTSKKKLRHSLGEYEHEPST